MMKNIFLLLFLALSLTTSGQEVTDTLVITNDTIQKKSIFEFLSKEEILEISIETNFDTIFTHKNKIVKYIPGKITLNHKDEEATTLKIGLRPRGKYRRRICDVPPMRVKFKKKGLKKIGLTGKYNSLKLVTHCRGEDKDAKFNIFKEYLIYQIYSLHSEYSLKAQLVKIKYIQSGTEKKLFSGYGFFIENADELAHRLDATIIEKMGARPDSLVKFECNVHSLFQCMIGNADWSLFSFRNIKFLKLNSKDKLCVFPYDFDFSGFVNAAYAIPNPDYKLKSIKDRVFLGKIYSEEEMQKAADHFLKHKDATIQLCKDFKKLPKYQRKEIIKYLKSFYKILESKEPLNEKLVELSPKK